LTLYKSKGFEIGNGNILVRDDKRKLIEGTEKTEADITALLWRGVDEVPVMG
jgi:hypothetical protein